MMISLINNVLIKVLSHICFLIIDVYDKPSISEKGHLLLTWLIV